MIGYLNGQVLTAAEGRVLLGIGSGEAGIVGYALHVPTSFEYTQLKTGSRAVFHVYTHVREDALDLFGFLTSEEKDIFLTLTSVSGIGPKTGLSILSACGAYEILRALATGDRDFLTGLPGIGKKTAERLIVELKDKLAAWADAPSLAASSASSASASKLPLYFEEARVALQGLGFKDPEIQPLLARVLEEHPGMVHVEQIVKLALKRPQPPKEKKHEPREVQ